MYYARDSSTDDAMPTEITVTQTQVQEIVQPPEIVDRQEVPKLKDQDILPSDLTEFDPDATDEPESGDPTELVQPAERRHHGRLRDRRHRSRTPRHRARTPDGGKKLGGKYGSRFGKGGKGGAGGRVNEAITLGLEWLRKHQDEDGRWDCEKFMKHDVNGEPAPAQAAPSTMSASPALRCSRSSARQHAEVGTYQQVVRKGVKWLVEQQERERPDRPERFERVCLLARDRDRGAVRSLRLSEHSPLKEKLPRRDQLHRERAQPVRRVALPAARQRQRHVDHGLDGAGAAVGERRSASQVDDAALKAATCGSTA
jgi:hypothetical protein